MVLVPPVGLRMSKDPHLWKYDLTSVHQIGIGSAPIGENITRELANKLNLTRIIQGRSLINFVG